MEVGSGIKITGEIRLQAVDAAGNVLWEVHEKNLVVNNGRANTCLLLGGDPLGSVLSNIGVGTSNTAASVSDTGLTGAFTKALNTGGTVNVYGTTFVKVGFKIDASEANGMTIREMGLFDGLGGLFSRRVLSTVIVKTSSFGLTGTWQINIT